MTKNELEEKLLATIAELRDASDNLTDLARDWAQKEHVYRNAKAVAYLKSDGTVQARQAEVDIKCGAERLAAHSAEALLNAAKEKKRALETEISAYMTMAGLMRSEMGLAGRYET